MCMGIQTVGLLAGGALGELSALGLGACCAWNWEGRSKDQGRERSLVLMVAAAPRGDESLEGEG